MKKTIQVMLVEDHPEYRESIEFVIGLETDIVLVEQFGNAEQALQFLEDSSRNLSEGNVDVVLLDLNLPGMSGQDAIAWIASNLPETKVIILSQFGEEADVIHAIECGASGYLLKSATMDDIKKAIRSVVDGGAILDPSLAHFILSSFRKVRTTARDECVISKREVEVLQAVAKGFSHKQIAEKLKITPYTVTDHLKHIYTKMEVPNAPAAVSKAYNLGILLSR